MLTLSEAVSRFGTDAAGKLANVAAIGAPEDQLRSPFEGLLRDIAAICNFKPGAVVAIGESSLADLKTRPDYAVAVQNALAGFIELKAPGKGADPRKFKDKHDKEQWGRLKSLPNLVYTDGNQFSLWRSGELVGGVVQLIGQIDSAGSTLDAPPSLLALFQDFLGWSPTPPRTAKQLAEMTARLCRLLRDEVTEQLALKSPSLTQLANDWRKLLFPDAKDEQFADGYAQAVTFGFLMARARGIRLVDGLDRVAQQLGKTNSLIGAALRLLTDEAENQAALKTSLGTLTRVLDAVEWKRISKGHGDAWLYFYEDFLEVYDSKLRKLTGSYYTPPQVVQAMVRFVDEALRSNRYSLSAGLASPSVTLADPAVGTGTFILGALRKVAETVAADEGEGAVASAINGAINRMIAFELQLGPFAVAQLRVLAELTELTGVPPRSPLRMFVADTLSNPEEEHEWIPAIFAPLAESRREANRIKSNVPITVVIGNPPYKEKAKGRGGWVESGGANSPRAPLLQDWIPPASWGVGAHTKHLRNLYVYFWRWATWKVFDHHPDSNTGMVCFITVAGFLNGPGFVRMRDYLRRKADEVWVIDCSPDGHQPEVSTRIFEGVQQPVCIVLASRSPSVDESTPAFVRFRSLPKGKRMDKFDALAQITLDDGKWEECPRDWRAAFLPEMSGAWATFPGLDELFSYNGSGVMTGRTWVIAPDKESLERRWSTLIAAPKAEQEELFHPHGSGDRDVNRVSHTALPGFPLSALSVAEETGPLIPPVRYGFRSLDRQWIIPDNRLLNRANPELWESRSDCQVYLTAPSDRSPSNGPAITFSAHVPDMHHYAGRGGRVLPLWEDPAAVTPNIPTALLAFLSSKLGREVSAADVFAYIAGVSSHPAFSAKFQEDLVVPGLRIPITADPALFERAVKLGCKVIWLHTFGERFFDAGDGRPNKPPRLPTGFAPLIPAGGAIVDDPAAFPDNIAYDAKSKRLTVGGGHIEGVTEAMWNYEVSDKQLVRQWFGNREFDRKKPIIGDRREPSRLGEIQPAGWPSEYTTELINLLNVIGLLVELEPSQAELLELVCSGSTITVAELKTAGVLVGASVKPKRAKAVAVPAQVSLL
jgi:hypothetical protein